MMQCINAHKWQAAGNVMFIFLFNYVILHLSAFSVDENKTFDDCDLVKVYSVVHLQLKGGVNVSED